MEGIASLQREGTPMCPSVVSVPFRRYGGRSDDRAGTWIGPYVVYLIFQQGRHEGRPYAGIVNLPGRIRVSTHPAIRST
jgi:hypothetical protein